MSIHSQNRAHSICSNTCRRAREIDTPGGRCCPRMTYKGLSRLQTVIDKINMWVLKNINVTSTAALHLRCCAFPAAGKVLFRWATALSPGGTLNLCVLTFKDTGFGCCRNDFCCLASACSDSSKELGLLFSSPADGVKWEKPEWGWERPALDWLPCLGTRSREEGSMAPTFEQPWAPCPTPL